MPCSCWPRPVGADPRSRSERAGRFVSSAGCCARSGRKAARGGPMSDDEPRAVGVARILIGDSEIRARTAEMAKELDRAYGDDVPLLVGVLNGAITFMTDLMREMTIPLEIDFMAVSSYGAATPSSGGVWILKELHEEIEGRGDRKTNR